MVIISNLSFFFNLKIVGEGRDGKVYCHMWDAVIPNLSDLFFLKLPKSSTEDTLNFLGWD